MKKHPVSLKEAAPIIAEALPKGILLNSRGEKFNTMVIGWGALGTIWGKSAFTVYVREGRFSRLQLDTNPSFTISVPLVPLSKEETRILGLSSGKDIDKVKEAKLSLVEANLNGVEGIAQYPLTLECRVLYRQKQDLSLIPEDIRVRSYPENVDSSAPLANRDAHIMYIGEILSCYRIGD